MNDTHAYVECGVAGFGLVQVPGIVVDGLLADGRLKEVLAPFRPMPRPVCILYPSKRYLAPQVRVSSLCKTSNARSSLMTFSASV